MSTFIAVFFYALDIEHRRWRFLAFTLSTVSMIGSLFTGARAGLFSTFVIIIAASALARYGKPSIWRLGKYMPIAAMLLLVGIVFISEYRDIRLNYASDTYVSPGETFGLFMETASSVANGKAGRLFSEATDRFWERLNAIELLAVTLGRAEELQAFEKDYGMTNNIVNEVVWAFIPRPLWPAKPTQSGDFGLMFNGLYTNSTYYTWSGPTIFGDLYRNYGIMGIVIGSIILGIYLRAIYEGLIKKRIHNGFAAMSYLFLLQTINYESTYAGFVSGGVRIVFLILVMSLINRICYGRVKRSVGVREPNLAISPSHSE
jgi:hypothetical protein